MKKAILLIAYGAQNPDARASLALFESLCRQWFPALPVRWAYSSLLIRERIALRRQKSDSIKKALMRLYFEKFAAVAIQPLQTIKGAEYEACQAIVEEARAETGMACALGTPLLHSPENMQPAARALLASLPPERKLEEDVVFMGHGARHPGVALYSQLAQTLNNMDKHVFLGTMNGAETLDGILPKLASRRVWLLPLLSIIGLHAIRDMAGERRDCWKMRIQAAGFECQPVLKGLAEYKNVAEIWLNNLKTALNGIYGKQA